MRVITLTTDFGAADWFVGTMRGVILSIHPRVQIVDITHGVRAGDVRAAAFTVAASCRFFPENTIHVAVVDPGVGSPRTAIAVQTENYVFVGPDNGVLSLALARERIKAIFQIRNPLLFLHPVSQTFHGRDVFAPVAAHLSKGLPLQKLGPRVRDFVRLDWPKPKISEGVMVGKIIYLDNFGNAITNISGLSLREFGSERCQVSVKRKPICRIGSFYQAVPIGKPVAVPGSSGFLEIAVNCGLAAKVFRLKVGDTVTVRWKSRQ